MEALENEKNEALRRITNYLTPRITGAEPCSIQEQIECEEERKSLSKRIEEIDVLLTESQELLFEEVENAPAEEILMNISGERLEFYTESLAGAILVRQEVRNMIEFEQLLAKEKLDEQKVKTDEYRQLYRDEEATNADLRGRLSASVKSESELLSENDELKQKNEELSSKLTNAWDRVGELEQSLRDALQEVNRTRQFTAQTDEEQAASIAAAKKDIEDSIIDVYNIRPKEGEYPSVTLVCNVAATGEEIEFHYFKKNKHKDIGEEKALAIQAMNKPVEAPQIDEVAEAELFQSKESAQDPDESTDSGEQREATEVEPETFEQRTDRRLTAIERRLDKDEPEFIHEVA